MQEYLLILKGDGMDDLSPDELQQLLGDYKAWVSKLGDQYVTGQRLQSTGTLVPNKNTVITDGPFLESKEIIAGFFLIKAKDQQHATAIAQSSPHVGLYEIEVRPLVQPLMH
ncbi:YciI family protein [Fulvivirgaceae bacterium BMA10]|uniref:YciI family protein n=1 Tax=Splendidivirga corallicola TaxID=3051826 RepID=A0ABT8KMY0_9BACT|nr:YciI family protein [Fulvivirgaceae bacterium BMA10]